MYFPQLKPEVLELKNIAKLQINFSIDTEKFGETRTIDLKPNGRNIPVTDENKLEYVHLVCHQKLTGSVREQVEERNKFWFDFHVLIKLRAFLEGFYEIIPKKLISIFDEQELELLISGLPVIDIDDLKANVEYHKYQPSSLQIQVEREFREKSGKMNFFWRKILAVLEPNFFLHRVRICWNY